MACAPASTGNAIRRPRATLMLRLIQPAEVFEHHAPLLGRETGQLVPRRIADFGACAGRPGEQRGGDVDAVGGGRRAAPGVPFFFWGLSPGAAGRLPPPSGAKLPALAVARVSARPP